MNAQEAALANRLAWLKKNHGLSAAHDRREYRLTLADGSAIDCFVIDVSASGIAISANIIPVVGATLHIGAIPGTVIRFLPVGFAIQFDALQEPSQIEAKLAATPAG